MCNDYGNPFIAPFRSLALKIRLFTPGDNLSRGRYLADRRSIIRANKDGAGSFNCWVPRRPGAHRLSTVVRKRRFRVAAAWCHHTPMFTGKRSRTSGVHQTINEQIGSTRHSKRHHCTSARTQRSGAVRGNNKVQLSKAVPGDWWWHWRHNMQ
jgi:hypothetical protein